MLRHFYFLAIFILLLTSCYKDHLYVQQERINEKYLASSHIGTPDPRALNPPKGERLLVSWDFPRSIYLQKLSLFVSIRFHDQTQKTFFVPIDKKRGVEGFYFPNPLNEKQNKILTYKVVAINSSGEEVAEWKHHFWTNLINIDQEEKSLETASFEKESNLTVDSKSKQESVTEQP